MPGILDMMNYIGQQNEAGRQRGLAQLVGKAYAAPPEQRQSILSTVAQRGGGDMAFNAQKHFESMDDDARTRLGQYAAAFDALPDDQKAAAYPQLAQQAQSLGIPAPNEWRPEFGPNIQKLAQALGGGGQEMKSLSRGANGNYWAIQNGQFTDTGIPFDPRTQLRDQPGIAPSLVNMRDGSQTPLGGAPQGQQRAPGEVPFSIDPSLPPEVQASIRDNESQWAQAPDGADIGIGGGGGAATGGDLAATRPMAQQQPSAMQERIALARSLGATDEQIKQMVVGGTAQGAAPDVPGDTTKTGDAYLATLPQQAASQVKALAEGRMAFPSGTALKSPYWQGMLSAVSQYDPNFDAVNYNARSNTRKGFTSGKEAQTVNALNTVAEHLGQFSDNAAALDNFSSLGPFTHFANRLKNTYLDERGDPRIAAFNTNKKAVADEVAKVWRASGGSEADIQENLRNLDGAQSPEQLNAAIGTLTQLIYGKINALQDQYASGMGTTQNPRPLVSPEAQSAFDKTLQRMNGGSAQQPRQQPAPVRAVNPQTGQAIELRNGQWVPVQ